MAPLQFPRAAMFASVAVGLAAGAHTLAGGEAPNPLACAVSVVALTQLAMLLGSREHGLVPIAALLLLTQLVLHPLFAAFPAHAHSAVAHEQLLTGGPGIERMEWAHLVATLVAAWWLRRGEARACLLAGDVLVAAPRGLVAALALGDADRIHYPSRIAIRPAEDRRVLRPRDPGRPVRRRGPPEIRVALIG